MIDLVRQQVGSLPAAGSAIEDPPNKDFENIGNTVFDRSCLVFLSLVLLFAAKVESLASSYSTVNYDMQCQNSSYRIRPLAIKTAHI